FKLHAGLAAAAHIRYMTFLSPQYLSRETGQSALSHFITPSGQGLHQALLSSVMESPGGRRQRSSGLWTDSMVDFRDLFAPDFKERLVGWSWFVPPALEWEEQLTCKQAVLHLDVTVHKDSSSEFGVAPLAELMRWCISASVSAFGGMKAAKPVGILWRRGRKSQARQSPYMLCKLLTKHNRVGEPANQSVPSFTWRVVLKRRELFRQTLEKGATANGQCEESDAFPEH
ncbi:unnamed protein product, partial [Pleuronectes platessa]